MPALAQLSGGGPVWYQWYGAGGGLCVRSGVSPSRARPSSQMVVVFRWHFERLRTTIGHGVRNHYMFLREPQSPKNNRKKKKPSCAVRLEIARSVDSVLRLFYGCSYRFTCPAITVATGLQDAGCIGRCRGMYAQ